MTDRPAAQDPHEETHRLATDTDNGMLLIMSGPSGVGKTTIARAIEKTIPDAVFSVSATTRPARPGDADGVDYHFLSLEQFERRIHAHEFLEHATYAGNHYGTLAAPTRTLLDRGRLVILDIDVQGAKQVKEKMPDAFALFILPPSEEVLLQRLRDRRSESDDVIARRYDLARQEIAEAKSSDIYDSFITNDDLDHAILEALSLVRTARAEQG